MSANNSQPSIPQLFASFLRLGITAFGGPSMVAYIRQTAVEKKHWLDEKTFSNGVALCQMIPGATAMQAAAYVGLKTRGVPGAGASYIGFGLPAFLLMMAFAALYTDIQNLPIVVSTFNGLQAVIVAIVANATISFGKAILKDWKTLVIAGIAALLFGLHVNPILVILFAASAGLVLIKLKHSNLDDPLDSGRVLTFLKPLLLIISITAIGLFLLFLFNRTLFNLSILMIRIDLFAFGGGFASIPLMLHEIVHVREWVDSQTFMNGIILGQVTPGPIVITATFIGYLLNGPPGGLVATISIFLPSFLMLVGISTCFDRLRSFPSFNKIISGVLGSFVGLLLIVTFRFASNVHWDLSQILLASGAFLALLLRVDILYVVLLGTMISVIK